MPWLIRGANILRADRCAKNVRPVLWIGNPANPRCTEVCVRPRPDMECESVHIYVSGSRFQTPVFGPSEVDAVEENDNLWWSEERVLKVNAHRGWGIWILPVVAHVFTGEKFQITGCECEHIDDGAPESGIAPGYDVAIGRTLCEVLESG